MATLRIYADFNGLVRGPRDPSRTAVVLDTFGSLRDLSNAGVVLSEGLPLVGVDASDEDEDLEGHGIARYDGAQRWWVIEFDVHGVRYVPSGDRTSVTAFNCVACKRDLTAQIRTVLRIGDRCSGCDTLIHAAIAPPIL